MNKHTYGHLNVDKESQTIQLAFHYSKDKQAEKEIREMTSFTIITNNIKYLAVILTKQIKKSVGLLLQVSEERN